MSLIRLGLIMTCWRVRQRWASRVKPRSPRQRCERISAFAGTGVRVKFPAAGGPFHRDVDAMTCAFIPGIGQHRQLRQVGAQEPP